MNEADLFFNLCRLLERCRRILLVPMNVRLTFHPPNRQALEGQLLGVALDRHGLGSQRGDVADRGGRAELFSPRLAQTLFFSLALALLPLRLLACRAMRPLRDVEEKVVSIVAVVIVCWVPFGSRSLHTATNILGFRQDAAFRITTTGHVCAVRNMGALCFNSRRYSSRMGETNTISYLMHDVTEREAALHESPAERRSDFVDRAAIDLPPTVTSGVGANNFAHLDVFVASSMALLTTPNTLL